MRRNRGPVVEIETLADFDRRLAVGPRSLSGWHLQAVDLRERSKQLRSVDVAGALFLGCDFANGDEASVRDRGAVVFPTVPDAPVDTYRGHLYTPEELYDTLVDHGDYDESLDARVYGWSRQPADLDLTLAQALHDHAIDDALGGWTTNRRMVGVMGGHALERDHPEYADAARLAQLLATAGLTVATGGGPGAMEAANLGAFLARDGEDALVEALAALSAVPAFRPDIGAWARAAFGVRKAHPDGGDSLGIPTWHYGHEPPNPFANHIAKYFRNATREAILLEICDAGIVFLPGAAGTVQEIFQDACENYYADPSSVAPMVLVGIEHWTRVVPAWPLLTALAGDRAMSGVLHLVDTVEEAAALLT